MNVLSTDTNKTQFKIYKQKVEPDIEVTIEIIGEKLEEPTQ